VKRFHILLFACLALVVAGSAWLAHVLWAQAAGSAEKTYTITDSKLETYVKKRIAEALGEQKDKVITDEQVRRPENWHFAVYDHAGYVIYTGPGQISMHHWVDSGRPPAKSGAGGPGAAPVLTPKN
jgi:hypothetical protein